MSKPPFLEEFLLYVANNPEARAGKQFVCGARPGEKPVQFNSLPAGDVFVYPEFLAFLTESNASGKWYDLTALWEEVGPQLLWLCKMAKWDNPVNVLGDIAKSINNFLTPKTLDKAMANPNSFFIPLRQVVKVEAGWDWHQGNFITIVTPSQPFILCNHMAERPNFFRDVDKGKNPFSNLKPFWGFTRVYRYVTGRWHTDVIAHLQDAVRRNGPAASPPGESRA
ncbi:MAG TPA: hypothetical protein VKD72_34720 [Gemmataceae bacterium]|nr:hypothetical protein [Gemmataceae bacterium]